MSAAMIMSVALCYAAMSGLSLAMPRHLMQISDYRLTLWQTRGLRWTASLILLLAYLPMWQQWGAGTGFLVWVSLLSVTTVVLVLLLSFWPKWAVRLAILMMLSASVLLLVQ